MGSLRLPGNAKTLSGSSRCPCPTGRRASRGVSRLMSSPSITRAMSGSTSEADIFPTQPAYFTRSFKNLPRAQAPKAPAHSAVDAVQVILRVHSWGGTRPHGSRRAPAGGPGGRGWLDRDSLPRGQRGRRARPPALAVYLRDGPAQPAPDAAGALESVAPGRTVGVPSRRGLASAAPSAAATVAARQASAPAPPKAPAPAGFRWTPPPEGAGRRVQALTIDPVPSGLGNLPEFRADCEYSHSLRTTRSSSPGSRAPHTWIRLSATRPSTRTPRRRADELTSASCKPIQDHSAYWVPTLYDNATGKPVETTGSGSTTARREGTRPARCHAQLPRMICGDAKEKQPTPRGAKGQFFCAFYGPVTSTASPHTNGNWPICGGDATLHFMMRLPDCWDGEAPGQPQPQGPCGVRRGQLLPGQPPGADPGDHLRHPVPGQGRPGGLYPSSDKEGKSPRPCTATLAMGTSTP